MSREGCRVLAFVFALFFSYVTAFAAPRLAVPKDGFELGEIPAGVQTSKTIELKNLSKSPLCIFKVRACCGAKATLSSMRIEPSSSAKLTLSLKPSVPGLITKQVEIVCDDGENSVVVIPVTGEAVEVYSENLASHWTVLTVLSAGFADGFNPCAFSIVIALAGILAAGGRTKKGRLLGGIAFSLASFLTYMAMGVGLMSALRAMDEMRKRCVPLPPTERAIRHFSSTPRLRKKAHPICCRGKLERLCRSGIRLLLRFCCYSS